MTTLFPSIRDAHLVELGNARREIFHSMMALLEENKGQTITDEMLKAICVRVISKVVAGDALFAE